MLANLLFKGGLQSVRILPGMKTTDETGTEPCTGGSQRIRTFILELVVRLAKKLATIFRLILNFIVL